MVNSGFEKMTSRNLLPDLEVTKTFLEALDAEGEFTFQTFDDNRDRGMVDWLKSFMEELKTIESHNPSKPRSRCFVVINKTDLNSENLRTL